MIQDAIQNRCDLKVMTANKGLFRVTPFKIETNDLGTARYLVGISEKFNEDSERRPASFRLSRLTIQHVYKSGRHITKKEQDILQTRIDNNDVAFLLTDEIEVIVKFSEDGKRKLQSVSHLRPNGILQKSTGTLFDEDGYGHFLSTNFQAKSYFQRLGGDAIVISPVEIRDELRMIYQNASLAYEAEIRG